MKNKNCIYCSKLFAIAGMFACLAANINISHAQSATSSNIVLSEGVVIEKNRKEIYITTPDAKVQAISLTTGQPLWKSTSKAKALNMSNGKLLVQSFDSINPSKLVISELDPVQKGSVKSKTSIQLPANVKTNLRPASNNAFNIKAVTTNGETYFKWIYHALPKGMPEGEEQPSEQSGAIKLTRSTNKLSNISKALLPKNLLEQPIIAPQNDSLSTPKTLDFLSKDGNHILRSEKTAGNEVFNNYSWEIYERTTNKLIGTLTDYRSFAPFYIDDATILYEIGPYTLSVNNQSKDTPLLLVAYDLRNKRELWRNAILNPDFTGLTPP